MTFRELRLPECLQMKTAGSSPQTGSDIRDVCLITHIEVLMMISVSLTAVPAGGKNGAKTVI